MKADASERARRQQQKSKQCLAARCSPGFGKFTITQSSGIPEIDQLSLRAFVGGRPLPATENGVPIPTTIQSRRGFALTHGSAETFSYASRCYCVTHWANLGPTDGNMGKSLIYAA